MNSATARVNGSGKEKKKLKLLYHVSGEGLQAKHISCIES
jgi:hypothetical protein